MLPPFQELYIYNYVNFNIILIINGCSYENKVTFSCNILFYCYSEKYYKSEDYGLLGCYLM
jgi:hypothetical protein